MSRSRLLFPVVAVVLALVAPATTAPAATPEARSVGPVRNTIVFLVDDMSDFPCASTEDFLPQSARWLRDRGTCYENASTATPVCCPARAQVQTGQLPHNNRVRTQLDASRLDVTDTVQHDLGLAGVRTYGIGKNLNGVNAGRYYGPHALDNGFDDFDFWNSYRQGPGMFPMYADDGSSYRPQTGLSSTETNGALLDQALDDYLATGERFYVYDAFFAPHKQAAGTSDADLPLPSPEHADARVPAFHFSPEVQAEDKLDLFQHRRLRSRSYYQRLWNARIRSLYDVDAEMARTFTRLETAGVLDETAVIFTSDNGYSDRGQANWDGKAIPYPAATDVPMLAFYPGRTAATVTKGVQLVDVAATVHDVMGVPSGHRLDGHSLLSDHRRKNMYGEFFGESDELVQEESGTATKRVPSWRLVKQGRWSYVEWYRRGGNVFRRELYGDPDMKRNVLWSRFRGPQPPAGLVGELHRRLHDLAHCEGTVEDSATRPCT